jgi:signal transduction histidine kinase
VRRPGLRFQIVAGFSILLVLGSAASFFAVFRLAGQLAGLDARGESRAVIERSLDRLRARPDDAAAAAVGREAILELSRLDARSRLAGRDLLIDTVAVFIGFLAVQLLILLVLSFLLSRALTRPMHRLLDGIRGAATAGPGFALPRLGGTEWSAIGQSFNELLRERDQQAALLAEQSRLSGWQEVASFLSHQLKNPLTAINLALENLEALEAAGLPENAEAAAEPGAAAIPASPPAGLAPEAVARLRRNNRAVIRQESQRLVELVRRFRSSTSLPLPTLTKQPLAAIVAAAQARFSPGQASFVIDLPPDLTLRADAQLLGEALANLFANSLQAWSDPSRPVEIRVAARRSGGGVRLTVADSVSGVNPDLATTILTTPFSTKPGGNGLGLVFVRSVMNRHHGRLSVALSARGGLEFTLDFPPEEQPWPTS